MSALTAFVLASLVAALSLVVIGWLLCGGPQAALTKSVGGPSWDISKSWGSNVTVVGAVVNTVLAAKVLPTKTVLISSSGYTALSLLFGALIVVAPLVFTALRKSPVSATGSDVEGWGVSFMLSTWMTLWGVVGELVTAGLVLYEAERGNTIPAGGVVPMWCVIGLALVLVGTYGFRTVRATIAPGTGTPNWALL